MTSAVTELTGLAIFKLDRAVDDPAVDEGFGSHAEHVDRPVEQLAVPVQWLDIYMQHMQVLRTLKRASD